MKRFTTKKQKLGLMGENIATRFLVKQGFIVLHRNWACVYGEIDIIVSREKILHFVEVKTISHKNTQKVFPSETIFTPLSQFHVKKQEKMLLSCHKYLLDNDVSHETIWQIDLIGVYVDQIQRTFRLNVLYECPLEI